MNKSLIIFGIVNITSDSFLRWQAGIWRQTQPVAQARKARMAEGQM